MRTPCLVGGDYSPELWVSDNPRDRAQAMRICRTECPADEFRACARLALDEPFGVMAGVDHHRQKSGGNGRPCAVCGVRNFSTAGHAPRTCEGCIETKDCAECGVEFPRRGQSNKQWEKAKYCGTACSGLTMKKRVDAA